ncbi:MAG: cation:proton antiporter [Planctomycetales bacterium]|nr:cation:proton antiporter [Planctomycetales bacterium]
MTQTLIQDLLVILAAGLLAGIVCRLLSVSVLIGYLLVGTLLGQGLLGWVSGEQHQLEQFAEVGVFLLLFTIGLEFSLDDLPQLGQFFLVGGALQMVLVAVPVACGLLWLGYGWQAAGLIAAAVSFSSTVLVFKALSEWGQAEQSHGQRAIAILLFQDVALVPMLLLVPLLTGNQAAPNVWQYVSLGLVSVLFVLAVVVLRRLLSSWLIPHFANFRSPELVILFTIVALGGITLAAYSVGLPPAIGALAAGIVFNGNRWSKQIDALVLPFRETFAAIFFVGLGLIFDPRQVWYDPLGVLAALLAVVAIKTVAATIALRATRLSVRRSLGMGIGLAHIGEFAFVLVLLGMQAGVLTEVDYQRVVAIAVGSLILTPPLMKAGLRIVQSGGEQAQQIPRPTRLPDEKLRAAVIGAGPIGRQVASQLEIFGHDVCLIDLSPINLHSFAQEGFRTVAGDATQRGILELGEVHLSRLVAVCVPQDETALQVVRSARLVAPLATLVVRCRYQGNSANLRRAGADHVVSEEAEASLALLQVLQKVQA